MDIVNEIGEVIKMYYPTKAGYSKDNYPNNTLCELLFNRCKQAAIDNKHWVSFMAALNDLPTAIRVIDETLLIGGEPSFRVSLTILGAEGIWTTYYLQVSVLSNYYFVYSTQTEKNEIPPPLIRHHGYNFDLATSRSKIYLTIKSLVEEWFPSHYELNGDVVQRTISNIVVPDKRDEKEPTIFECLFGVRLF